MKRFDLIAGCAYGTPRYANIGIREASGKIFSCVFWKVLIKNQK